MRNDLKTNRSPVPARDLQLHLQILTLCTPCVYKFENGTPLMYSRLHFCNYMSVCLPSEPSEIYNPKKHMTSTKGRKWSYCTVTMDLYTAEDSGSAVHKSIVPLIWTKAKSVCINSRYGRLNAKSLKSGKQQHYVWRMNVLRFGNFTVNWSSDLYPIPVQPLTSRLCREWEQDAAKASITLSVIPRMPCKLRTSRFLQPAARAHTPSSVNCIHQESSANLSSGHLESDTNPASATTIQL